MSDSVRTWLDTNLAPLFPEGWRWVPYQRNTDSLDAVTVQWKQSRILPLSEAPMGVLRVEGTVTVMSPRTDVERAEEELDEAIVDLLAAIDALAGLAWTEATKVVVNDGGNFGWDISVWTTATKNEGE